MANFTVEGPFNVPCEKKKAGRVVTTKNAKEFWTQHPGLKKKRGCYVFAFRAAKGIKPVYVGQATKSFEQEVFTDHKRNRYGEGLADQKKGTPILYLVSLDVTKGKVNKLAIDQLETFLIQIGLVANKDLLNDRKTSVPNWSVAGVIRSGKGKPSKAATSLRKCLKLES